MPERVERWLTTILAADVAEYSRLMRADEDATLARLTRCRDLAVARIAEHRGRIANTAGDAVLAEFPSVADGLSCALAIQEAVGKDSETLPPHQRMLFRIGVHVGDVMVRDGDLFGDAVNVAARLQALAEPGGICVSAPVREHAGSRIAATFTDTGAQQVKNIPEPVHVFRVTAGRAAAAAAPVPLALPDKPSVAVLPFTNMSADPEQEFFADGIAEDVITALSRYPSLFVIARNSCFTYKGRAVDVKEVGRELGVRYVLEGGLRKSGSRIRVTAQLVEAETGKHVWAERYDRDLADIFAVQDEITEAVTIAVAPAIDDAELHRAMRKPPGSLDAWAAYQRGLWHLGKVTANDCSLAEEFFRRAIDLDRNFADAHSDLALAQVLAGMQFRIGDLADALNSAESSARQAVALEGNNAAAHASLSNVLRLRGDHRGALTEAESALRLSPNLAFAYAQRGSALVFSGWPREGIRDLQMSLRLDPRGLNIAFRLQHLAIGYYFSRAYEDAIEAFEQAIRSFPELPGTYTWLPATLGQLGRIEEAKEALEKAIAVAPSVIDRNVSKGGPYFRPEDHAHMLEGLREAGWRE